VGQGIHVGDDGNAGLPAGTGKHAWDEVCVAMGAARVSGRHRGMEASGGMPAHLLPPFGGSGPMSMPPLSLAGQNPPRVSQRSHPSCTWPSPCAVLHSRPRLASATAAGRPTATAEASPAGR